ncbi:uncharacterized protein LOC108221217 [Daucus carota subsp. sativus]
MEFTKVYHFLCVKGLLVKCSEAGNLAARHMLGKVILLSSTHLLFSETKSKILDVSNFDIPTVNCWIRDAYVPLHNMKVCSFMSYFFKVSSPKRLVHHQVVKFFLLNGSHHDFVEMAPFLKYYVMFFTKFTGGHCRLINSIELLARTASRVRTMEKLTKTKESLNGYIRGLGEFIEMTTEEIADRIPEDTSGKVMDYLHLQNFYLQKCTTDGVDQLVAMTDANFVEALRDDVLNLLYDANIELSKIRAATVGQFENKFE